MDDSKVKETLEKQLQLLSKRSSKNDNEYYKCGLRKWSAFPLISRCSLLVSLTALIISWLVRCTTG